MRRMLWAGLLALPMLLAAADTAKAQGCSTCGPFAGTGRPMGWYGPQGPFGCNGFCLKLFPTWLQDGPLVNYGPYEGYYPFAPYGPWTADGRYTGPRSRGGDGAACGLCGRHGCGGACGGGGGLGGHLGGLFHKQQCGDYAMSTYRNVFSRVHAGCKSCGY